MNVNDDFKRRNSDFITQAGSDEDFLGLTRKWISKANSYEYSYHYSWLGRPIIQYPQDIVALQEIIWEVRPDLIIETGIAHGGSLILSASCLAMLDYCDAYESGKVLDPKKPRRKVLGVDIDIRKHNRTAIESHPMSDRIYMIEGSSIAPEIIENVKKFAKSFKSILILLDSNHTHNHVLAELEAYAPLTSVGSYCVVFDTVIEELPENTFNNRPWGRGNNPKTAVREFLSRLKTGNYLGVEGGNLVFETDNTIVNKLLISVAPQGYLKRV